MNLNTVAICLFVTFLFHVFRNLSLAYYCVFAVFALIFIIKVKLDTLFRYFPILCIALIGYYLLPLITSFFNDSTDGPVVGIFRLFPSAIAIILSFQLAKQSIDRPLLVFVLFYLLAAFSIVWQYQYGAVDFFAEASERAGGARYSSLVGSLTAYGGLVGLAILSSLYLTKKKPLLALVLLVILSIGAFLSLQKSSIVSVIISICFAFWIRLISLDSINKNIMLLLIVGLLLFFVFDAYVPESRAFDYMQGFFTSDSSLTADTGFLDSIYERIVDLPVAAVEYHGLENITFGVGVYGGSGGLGYPELPMAHNGLVENILVAGIFGLMLDLYIIGCFLFSFKILLKRKASQELLFLCACIMLWTPSYILTGGGLYQPVSAVFIWLVLFRFLFLVKSHDRGLQIAR